MDAQTDAARELNRLHAKMGSWAAVGKFIANEVGGSHKSWMAIANSVANGRRRPTHSLLVALGLKERRRRFSVDVPTWATPQQEIEFRSYMKSAANRWERRKKRG